MIESLRDLEKFLKLCRKQGVQEIDLHGLKVKLGDLPEARSSSMTTEELLDPYKNFPTGELTPEQLMFYSAGGLPDEDPQNQAAG